MLSLSGARTADAQQVIYDSSAAASVGIYRPAPPRADTAAGATRDAAGSAADTNRARADTSRAAAPAAAGRDTTVADTARGAAAPADTTRPDTTRADTAAADTSRAEGSDTVVIGVTVPDDAGSLTARMDVRRGGGLDRTEFPNLWRSADLTGRYHIFLDLVDRSALRDRLMGDSLVTVLAPTDSAFARISAGDLARLRADTTLLDAWLESLMLEGSLGSRELVEAGTVVTRGGMLIRFSRADGVIHAGPARVVQPDLVARNGTLHGVDRVVVPEVISASP